MRSLLATLLFAVALAPFATAAQKPATKSAMKEAKATGTIVSASDTNLIVSMGKSKKETTFTLSPTTRKEGMLAPGAKVAVQYHMDGSNRIASLVKASPMASTSSGASKAGKPKSSS